MARLTIYKDNYIGSTAVSNYFIDRYMRDANDAQLKVYLYLLRMTHANLAFGVSDIADQFNHTEKEVLRALCYWEKKKLLALDYDRDKALVGIHLRELRPDGAYVEMGDAGTGAGNADDMDDVDPGRGCAGANMDAAGITNDAVRVAGDAVGGANDAVGVTNDAVGVTNDAIGGANNAIGEANDAADVGTGDAGVDGENARARAGRSMGGVVINMRQPRQYTGSSAMDTGSTAMDTGRAAMATGSAAMDMGSDAGEAGCSTGWVVAEEADAYQLTLQLPEPMALSGLHMPPQICPGRDSDEAPDPYAKPSYSADQLRVFKEQESTAQLLYVAQTYVARPLTASDMKTILYMSDVLHFSDDLIDYLVQYCVDRGKKDFRYMERVAVSWAQQGITTPRQAQKTALKYDRSVYAIMNELGKSSAPTSKELEYINRWLGEYGFSPDIIFEACERTVLAVDKHRFEYAEGILSSWRKENVRHKADIRRVDERHQKQKAPAAPRGVATNNKFNQFKQNSYDFEALEKELLSN